MSNQAAQINQMSPDAITKIVDDLYGTHAYSGVIRRLIVEYCAALDAIDNAADMLAGSDVSSERAAGVLAAKKSSAAVLLGILEDFDRGAWRFARDHRTRKADAVKRADVAVRRQAQDAAWAKAGLERCDRCGGAGGWEGWPGFTCYKCGGKGAVPASDVIVTQ